MEMIGPSSAAAILEMATTEELRNVMQSRLILAGRLRTVILQQPASQVPGTHAQPAQPPTACTGVPPCPRRHLLCPASGAKGRFRCLACLQTLLGHRLCQLSPRKHRKQARRLHRQHRTWTSSGTSSARKTRKHTARIARQASADGTTSTTSAPRTTRGTSGAGTGGRGATTAHDWHCAASDTSQ